MISVGHLAPEKDVSTIVLMKRHIKPLTWFSQTHQFPLLLRMCNVGLKPFRYVVQLF